MAGGANNQLLEARHGEALAERGILYAPDYVANASGVSQPDEVHTLPSFDVTRLHLDYKESKRVDEHGNRFRYRAKADDAKGAKVNRWA